MAFKNEFFEHFDGRIIIKELVRVFKRYHFTMIFRGNWTKMKSIKEDKAMLYSTGIDLINMLEFGIPLHIEMQYI